MVEAKGLGKRYGASWVFRRVEFKLKGGDCLLVTGPNGSGKSTLLKLVAGLEAPTEGRITTQLGDCRTSLGYASPHLRPYPALTGREHLELSGRLRGEECESGKLLAMVGLAEAADKPTGAYSDGMRSRLRLALAIQTSPKLLLLDEPGAGLDEEGRRLVERIVSEQRERGCVIVATNDPSERRFGEFEIKLGG